MSNKERARIETENKTENKEIPFPKKGIQPPFDLYSMLYGILEKVYKKERKGEKYALGTLTRWERVAYYLDHPEKKLSDSKKEVNYENLLSQCMGIGLHDVAVLTDIWDATTVKKNGPYRQRLHKQTRKISPTSRGNEILRLIRLLDNKDHEMLFDAVRKPGMERHEGRVYRVIGETVLKYMKKKYPFTNSRKFEEIEIDNERLIEWELPFPDAEKLNNMWEKRNMDQRFLDKVECMFLYHQNKDHLRHVLASPQTAACNELRLSSVLHPNQTVFYTILDKIWLGSKKVGDTTITTVHVLDYKSSPPRIPGYKDTSYRARFYRLYFWVLAKMLNNLTKQDLIQGNGTAKEMEELSNSLLEPLDVTDCEVIIEYAGFGKSNDNPYEVVNVTDIYEGLWTDPLKNRIMMDELRNLTYEIKNNDLVKELVGL